MPLGVDSDCREGMGSHFGQNAECMLPTDPIRGERLRPMVPNARRRSLWCVNWGVKSGPG
jgi:hypothetical protein